MVRKAGMTDLNDILAIYAYARGFMEKTGNPTQWGNHYPPEDLLREDIKKQRLYVLFDDAGLYGVFAFIIGDDPTYAVIENGAWQSCTPYGTLHRVAASGRVHGVMGEAMAYAQSVMPHLRIDTHADNTVMQHQIIKHGFSYCGIIHTDDGSPRYAYELLCKEQND